MAAKNSYKSSKTSHFKNMKKLFEEQQGEVTISKSKCNTVDLDMVMPFARPKFTKAFIRGLEVIQDSIDNGSTDEQEGAVKKFIKGFGTHYAKKTDFGAMLVYERRFTARSTSTEESQEKEKCSTMAAEMFNDGCIEFGFNVAYKVEAEAQHSRCEGTEKENCNGDNFDNKWGEENDIEITKQHTIGSFGGNLDGWETLLTENTDKVLPIERELKLMSHLFQPEWLSESKEYGFYRSLNGTAIAEIFNKTASEYCEKIMGLNRTVCLQKIKGCGLNSICDFTEKCENKPNTTRGYECIKKGTPSTENTPEMLEETLLTLH